MGTATTQIFLGDTPIPFYYVGQDQVGLNPKSSGTVVPRFDAYSASLKMAIPFSVFTELGMTSFTQSIDGLIRENNINNSFRVISTGSILGTTSPVLTTTASVAISGSNSNYNWINDEYITSAYMTGSQNITGASSASLQFGSSSFVIEMWVKNPPALFLSPPFNTFFFGTVSGTSMLFDYRGSSTQQFRFQMATLGDSITAQSAANPFTSSYWHHLALVRSGTTGSIYFDGQRIASASSAGFTGAILDPEDNYWRVLGNVGNNNDGAAKQLQDFRIYIGTNKNYTGSIITPPESMIEFT
jgi:hypothetical protein